MCPEAMPVCSEDITPGAWRSDIMEATVIDVEMPSSSNLSQYTVKWRPDDQLQLGEPNYVVAVRQLNPPREFIISMPVRNNFCGVDIDSVIKYPTPQTLKDCDGYVLKTRL